MTKNSNLDMTYFLSCHGVKNFLQFDAYHSKNGHLVLDIFQFYESAAKPLHSILEVSEGRLAPGLGSLCMFLNKSAIS